MLEDYRTEKDRIIIEQQHKISCLSDESERLRRERDELLSVIRELESCPGSNLAVLSSTLACECPQFNITDYAQRNYSARNNSNRPAAPVAIVSQQGRSRTKSGNLVNPLAIRPALGPTSSISDGCISTKLPSTRQPPVGASHSVLPHQLDVAASATRPPAFTRQRSFKRVRNQELDNRAAGFTRDSQYELSPAIQDKQIEMIERKYGGGTLKTRQAAEIIQYNFRQYTLSKNFERLKNTKDEMRVQRMMSDVSSEKDSVWSDVTVTPYSAPPPPMPLLDIEHTYAGVRSRMPSGTVTPPRSADGSFASNKAVAGSSVNYPHHSHRISSPTLSSPVTGDCTDRLHMVVHPVKPLAACKDSNDNITSPRAVVSSPLVATAYDNHSDSLGELTCSCQSSDSGGDTTSLGSNGDLISYSRNHSVSDSKLLNVRVQFNKCSDKERKRQYRIGLNLFNKKPEKGIKYLMEQRFLENSSRAVARFLLQRKGLSKQMIGEYLGNLQNLFNQDVLLCVVQELDFAGTEIDQALRKLIAYFRLPGEAQKIERIIERFAQRYCLCNSTFIKQFQSVDTVFLIAFAIIMLNTDLHNPNIKPTRKMRLEAFIKNLKGIDRGSDVSADMLAGIYERIQDKELKTGADHTTQVRKVEETMAGKLPQLVVPHRRLVCYCRLYEIQDPQRKEKLGLHQREVFLFNDILVITKIFTKKKNSITYSFRQSLSLSDILAQSFETEYYQFGIKLVSKIDRKPLMCFNARNQHDREKFLEDLKESIAEMQEMDTMRISDELRKQNLMESDRLSKDSGVVDIELIKPSRSTSSRLSAPDYNTPPNRTSDSSAEPHQQSRSTSLTELDKDSKKRHSNGSVDSGMVSTSTGSMASREDSPNFHHKVVGGGFTTSVQMHSPPQPKFVSAQQKKMRMPSAGSASVRTHHNLPAAESAHPTALL